jgi:ABC-type methionine transport system ATPase subunit
LFEACLRPGKLSGGQQQRVGIARAIVTDPTLIVADEPAGDLDSKFAGEILDLLAELQRSLEKSIIMVTHDPRAAERAHRLLHLEKGGLVQDNGVACGAAGGTAILEVPPATNPPTLLAPGCVSEGESYGKPDAR